MTRTQKYIDKFCEYIDRLISFWEGKGISQDDVWKFLYKADFIASVLDIKGKGFISLNSYDWGRRDYLRNNEQEAKEAYHKNGMEFKTRIEYLNEWKQRALAIQSPIKSIETYDYNSKNITQEGITKLLESLKYMQSAIDSGVYPRDIQLYGVNTNQLVMEMGLVNKYRATAIENHLIRNDKILPYNRSDWVELFWQPSENLQNKIKYWTERAKSLAKCSEGILPENCSLPITLSEMAGHLKMTPRKLTNLLKSNYYRHKKLNRQTYIFDVSQFPPAIQAKITAKS